MRESTFLAKASAGIKAAVGSKLLTYLGTDKPKPAFKAMRMDESTHEVGEKVMKKREKKNLERKESRNVCGHFRQQNSFKKEVVVSCDNADKRGEN